MIGVGLAVLRVPEVMGDEFQQYGLGRRPGEGGAGRGKRPGFEIGEVAGERLQRVGAWAFVDPMTQGFYVLVGQQLGELVAPVERQHRGDRVQLCRPPLMCSAIWLSVSRSLRA